MSIFVFVESKPFDYRTFAQYLFQKCPNLKQIDDKATQKATLLVVQIELHVDVDTAKNICKIMLDLGFINTCGWGGSIFSSYFTKDSTVNWSDKKYFYLL